MMLRVEEHQYPNESTYGVFFLGRHKIGQADRIDGGWRLNNSSKVYASDEGAAKEMIDRLIRKSRNDMLHARNMMEELRKHRWRMDKESVRAVPPLNGGEESIKTHAG